MSSARSCSWIVLVLFAAASSPVLAQDQDVDLTLPDSRTARLAAERDKKATELTPPQRTKVEKALFRYDNSVGGLAFIFESWPGFQLAGGGFPAGAGTNFGVRYTHDLGRAVRPAADPNRANRVELDTLAAYSIQGYFRGAAAVDIHHLAGAPLDLRFGAQHYEYPQEERDPHRREAVDDDARLEPVS